MSESDAVWPSFVTWVESLTLTASVSSFFVLSNFWTLPVTSLPIDADAWAPVELLPMEPDALDPAELPVEPDVLGLDVLGLDVLLDEPIRSVDEPDVLDFEPDADDPLEPVEPVEPADPLVCAQAGAATSSPAVARPTTLPHSIFMFPLHCSVWRRTRHPAVVVVLASDTVVTGGQGDRRGMSDRLAT